MTKPATALEVAQPSAVRLAAVGLQATVCASEALSITSLRHDGEELVVEPDQLPPAFRVHDAFAGITLMHPWANRLGQDSYTVAGVRAAVAADDPSVTRDANGLAIHGLRAPAGAWRLSRVSPASARAVLSSAADSAFPFPHELEVTIAVTTERLAVTTVLRPSGDLAVPVTFGWHPYFRLPGADRATWRLALPGRRHLQLSPEGIPTGASATEPAEDAPLGARMFDDGYEALAPESAFGLAGGGRRIRVRLAGGYRAAQVFAPEAAAVAALEPMTAPTNALVSGRGLQLAQPGAAFGASFSVEVVRDARSARYPGRPESLRLGAGRGG